VRRRDAIHADMLNDTFVKGQSFILARRLRVAILADTLGDMFGGTRWSDTVAVSCRAAS
jgi:hypothetical protein